MSKLQDNKAIYKNISDKEIVPKIYKGLSKFIIREQSNFKNE